MILEDSWDMKPEKRGRRGVSDADDEDDDYRRKRDRNNEILMKFGVEIVCIPEKDIGYFLSRKIKEFQWEYKNLIQADEVAVKKSRYKSKQRTQETFTRVNKLKAENQALEEKVKTLTKDLQFLKELFMEYASNTDNPKFEGIDLEKLLEDVPDEKKGSSSKA